MFCLYIQNTQNILQLHHTIIHVTAHTNEQNNRFLLISIFSLKLVKLAHHYIPITRTVCVAYSTHTDHTSACSGRRPCITVLNNQARDIQCTLQLPT